MSHFTVTITGEKNTFEDQMAPYAEQEVRPQFLTFHDTEEENRKEYLTETRQEFYCSSSSSHGQVVQESFFKQLRGLAPGAIRTISFTKKEMDTFNCFKLNEYYHVGNAKPDHSYPTEQIWVKVKKIQETEHPDRDIAFEGTIQVEVVNAPRRISFLETYATFEEFMKDWNGSEHPDPKTGRYGYWSNPNAKWDYWRIGGRWAGHWSIKPEFQDLYSNATPKFDWEWTFTEKSKKEMEKRKQSKKVDSALKCHIDFEAMMKYGGERAAVRYDFVWKNIIQNTPVNEPWGPRFYDKREEYRSQPRVKAWNDYCDAHREECEAVGISLFGSSVEDFNGDREKYIQKCRLSAISTFAFLHNGEWAARGEMGWWACVSNEQDDWEEAFWKILNTLPDDTRLTVLDCHI